MTQREYVGKDGRSHFRVTGGNCHCGWSIINDFEWEQHLRREAIARCQARSKECGQCELREGHEGKHLAGYLMWGA